MKAAFQERTSSKLQLSKIKDDDGQSIFSLFWIKAKKKSKKRFNF
jgi:hypothetical protein